MRGVTWYLFTPWGFWLVDTYIKSRTWELAFSGISYQMFVAKGRYKHGVLVQWSHGLRRPNKAFFYWNLELLGLGRKIGQLNSGAFGVFSSELSAPVLVQWVPCFLLFNHYFYKNVSLYMYPHPKYLFGIGIGIWAAKN